MARTSRKNNDAAPVQAAKKAMSSAGAYIRLSPFDKREKNDSIETQQAIISAYIAEQVDIELREIYIDSGVSGQTFERPAFQRMIADMESGKINCCIAKDLSRIGRNAIDTGYYIEKHFPAHNIRCIAINDDYDSAAGQSGGIMVSLKNMINETYAIDIGRKTKATKQMQIREGEFVGKVPPYGYMKSAEDCHKFIPDSDAASVVGQIYQMFLGGRSVRDICNFLNENGVLPPIKHFYAKGWISIKDSQKSDLWSIHTIAKILCNGVYCGDMIQGRYSRANNVTKRLPKEQWVVVPNTHVAIIEREVFEKVQSMLNTPKLHAPRFKTPTTENIFNKKLYCGHCKYAMSRRRAKEDKYVLKCHSQTVYGKSACRVVTINEVLLKETVLALLQKQIEIFAERQAAKDTKQADSTANAELRSVQSDIQRNSNFLKGLYESLVSGDITVNEYKDLKASYETSLNSLATREKALRDGAVKIVADEIKGQKAANSIRGLRCIDDLSANVLEALVEKIYVFEGKRIEVHYRFTDETARGGGGYE